jgi:hypothetical protein
VSVDSVSQDQHIPKPNMDVPSVNRKLTLLGVTRGTFMYFRSGYVCLSAFMAGNL